MNVELAKSLISSNFFSAKKEEKDNLLKEKLIQFMRMYLEKDEKEKREGKKFFVQLTKEGLIYKTNSKSSQDYLNIGANEKGWDWNMITGPDNRWEYLYSKHFGGRGTGHFEKGSLIYFSLFRYRTLKDSREIVEKIMTCQTLEELSQCFDNMAAEYICTEELIEGISVIMEDTGGNVEGEQVGVIKMFVLLGYYLLHYIDGTEMDESLLSRMNEIFCKYFPDEDVDAQDYMDFFLDTLEESINCSKEAQRMIMDLLLSVYFSYSSDENGVTPTLYIYSSEPLLEYKKLRDVCRDSELVPYLDKLVPMLEDPAFVFPGDTLYDLFLESDSCVVAYGYTEKEYVCCYYYYDNSWENKEDLVKFDFAFSVARQCFEVLLEELKQFARC